MRDRPRVEVFYSLQSDYCYFLLDRLLALAARDVEVVIRPVLGLVLRMPDALGHRSEIEVAYFTRDTERTAAFLGLPYVYPNPSPIRFKPGPGWVATKEQPLVERLFRLFVGAVGSGYGLVFLDTVARRLWDGRGKDWDQGTKLADWMAEAGLDHDHLMQATSWEAAKARLDENHDRMLTAGHWGVPLMVYEGEPFYGQDRFDQLLLRMGLPDPA